MPKGKSEFNFTEGRYRIEVYAHLLGDKKPIHLFSQKPDISKEIAGALEDSTAGVYFDWGSETHFNTYPTSKKPL